MSDVISEAKSVVTSHEGLASAGDLDGVMSNMADDIVALVYRGEGCGIGYLGTIIMVKKQLETMS